ncbi:MAG: hypothetical protein ABDH91_09215, partial [Bacteroidia bacterium]
QGTPVEATITRVETSVEYRSSSSSVQGMRSLPKSVTVHQVTLSFQWQGRPYIETVKIEGDQIQLREGQKVVLRCAEPPGSARPLFIVILRAKGSIKVSFHSTSLPISCLMEL